MFSNLQLQWFNSPNVITILQNRIKYLNSRWCKVDIFKIGLDRRSWQERRVLWRRCTPGKTGNGTARQPCRYVWNDDVALVWMQWSTRYFQLSLGLSDLILGFVFYKVDGRLCIKIKNLGRSKYIILILIWTKKISLMIITKLKLLILLVEENLWWIIN